MKKMILAAVAVAVVGMSTPTAHAGDREWATVGKVLTGVAAGVVIANAIDNGPGYASVGYSSYGCGASGVSVSYSTYAPAPCPPPPRVVYVAPAPVYVPAPVVCAPPVVVYRPAVCAPAPVVCAPAPVRYVSNGHGHGYGYGHGRWNR
ncbi:MAG: hypothetical protein RLY20_1494 [Verrucomicrobiota bacterium]|jgi:hypothetical protein